jgi:hypothetical protein
VGLTVPSGFAVRSFNTVYRDDTSEPPYVQTGETRLISEGE